MPEVREDAAASPAPLRRTDSGSGSADGTNGSLILSDGRAQRVDGADGESTSPLPLSGVKGMSLKKGTHWGGTPGKDSPPPPTLAHAAFAASTEAHWRR